MDFTVSPSGCPLELVYGYARLVSDAASKSSSAEPANVSKLGMSAVAQMPYESPHLTPFLSSANRPRTTSMPISLVDCMASASRVADTPSLYGGTHMRGLVAPAWCR